MSETNFNYKGRPVVRKGNEIYYGSMSEPYVVWMQIKDTDKQGEMEIATKLQCYLMKTEPGLKPLDAVVKTVTSASLYEALELAAAWLKMSNPKTAD